MTSSVEEYISGIITKATDILLYEGKQASGNKADDSVSLTPSVISGKFLILSSFHMKWRCGHRSVILQKP